MRLAKNEVVIVKLLPQILTFLDLERAKIVEDHICRESVKSNFMFISFFLTEREASYGISKMGSI